MVWRCLFRPLQCPVVKSIRNERSVEVMDGLGVVIAENHLGVFGSIFLPFFLVKSGDFVVYQFLDIRLGYGASKN